MIYSVNCDQSCFNVIGVYDEIVTYASYKGIRCGKLYTWFGNYLLVFGVSYYNSVFILRLLCLAGLALPSGSMDSRHPCSRGVVGLWM